MTESTIVQVLSRFDPSMLLLLIVLFGVWRLARDLLAASNRVADEVQALRADVSRMLPDVASHEERLTFLERGLD